MVVDNTTLLLILDGWGHREEIDNNAIAAAKSPNWDNIWTHQPKTLIDTSGESVGLPNGQMGNSEVGHMNLGAGRVVYQNLTRIDKDIEDSSFYKNKTLTRTIDKAISSQSAVHILGLMSPGGIHSHEDQIMAMVNLALNRGVNELFLHAFLDGRDTPPRSALPSLVRAEDKLVESGKGRVASICGRFYAMDRDNRWDRIQLAYDMLVQAEAEYQYKDVKEALNAAYSRNEDDEFVRPTLIGENKNSTVINDDDVVIFMNFRADRAREITRAFVEKDFRGFKRLARPNLGEFVMLTEYAADIDAAVAYPPQQLDNVLGAYLASLEKKQLRIAETEKYAHVTFFFNGGREEPFKNEDRILIPSPKVKTYDLKPEMSAFEVTEKLVEAISSQEYDAIICNYANGDMVGHTGNFKASIKAVETIDKCLGKIIAAIKKINGHLLITADHGNVEKMLDSETNQPLTSHTSGPVPLAYVGHDGMKLKDKGSLCDIAPTMLTLMNIEIPEEMTGTSLLD